KAWLDVAPPAPDRPAQIEEFLSGDEGSYDSVMIDGRVVWDSVSDYLPTPLEVLRHPWMQWVVRLPRDIGGQEYAGIRQVAPDALRALGLRTGLSHMEWFRRPDGSVAVSEVGARHRLPARPGRRPGPRRARPGRAAARGDRAGGRLEAAPSRPAVLGQLRGRRLDHDQAPGDRRGHRRAQADRQHRAGGARMTNVLMISPGYPAEMAFFTRGLGQAGVTVIGLGDQHTDALPPIAKEALDHYVQ